MKFTNVKDYQKYLETKVPKKVLKKTKKTVSRATMLVTGDAISSIQAGGSGESVQKYNPNRVHTQSKANNPPATDTGFLVSQITMNVKTEQNGTVVGQIISAAPYSKALEFGTVNMQPRPFMQPALNKNKKKIIQMFVDGGLIK